MSESVSAVPAPDAEEGALAGLPLVRIDSGVLVLPISTTENAGALSDEALQQSAAALDALGRGEVDAGAVLLVGLGKHFSVGGNVRGFHEAEDTEQTILDTAGYANSLVTRLAALEIPVVAAVKGAAAGGAIGFCLAADIAVGGEGTNLAFAYSAIGLSPDCGVSHFLPRVVGSTRAADLLLTSARISGEEAHSLGILSRNVGAEDVEAAAMEIARGLASGPRDSYASIKALLAAAWTGPLDASLRAERFAISKNSVSADGREGVAAFVERRAPRFGA
ncbi:enoyl-CoA hydratase/isomerase family protein [Dietzia sp.]|uniref:enoyl-CoA hydratase/isomerase family protein n=1 Tax=Dietzia sp. TaxID=1871616 RepID=UPI002FD8E164